MLNCGERSPAVRAELHEPKSRETKTARTAAATDATSMVERFSRDLSTGTAHMRGVTESESNQAQALVSHYDKLSEMSDLSKEQVAALTADAGVSGGLGKVVGINAGGGVQWRGQTIERDTWQKMQDYAEQHQVLDLWSSVSEASRRYSTATGESDMASLEESYGANLSRMRQHREQASMSYQSAETWSEQAARVRTDAQAIDRELGQPFFAWLSQREGTDGRPIGVGGAMRLASPCGSR